MSNKLTEDEIAEWLDLSCSQFIIRLSWQIMTDIHHIQSHMKLLRNSPVAKQEVTDDERQAKEQDIPTKFENVFSIEKNTDSTIELCESVKSFLELAMKYANETD